MKALLKKSLPSVLDEVMSMDQSDLKIILENHILKNKIVLSQLFNGQRLETVGGKFLRVFIYRTVSHDTASRTTYNKTTQQLM